MSDSIIDGSNRLELANGGGVLLVDWGSRWPIFPGRRGLAERPRHPLEVMERLALLTGPAVAQPAPP